MNKPCLYNCIMLNFITEFNNTIMRKIVLIITLLVFSAIGLQAQKTAVYNQPDAKYRDASELFEKEKFGAAREVFREVIRQINDDKSVISVLYLRNNTIEILELIFIDFDHTKPTIIIFI